MTCSVCGVEHWRDGKACANAIVARRDGRILLTRRGHSPWRDLWCAPGGFADHLEPPEETARREAREETGLEIRITGLLGIWVDTYADDSLDDDADWISVAYFAAEAENDVLVLDPLEVAEARWFALDELPEGLAPPGTLRSVLEAWEAGRRRSR
ncbi:MAG: NUDIX hydrolase [Actinobacteria bacterium]|nr:NUDIX hydrolase [Actinomycetota bacterium]